MGKYKNGRWVPTLGDEQNGIADEQTGADYRFGIDRDAEITRLTNLIEEHNAKCDYACRTTGRSECLSADAANSRCLRCPKNWMIDTQDGVK